MEPRTAADFPAAVPLLDIPAQIGDTYSNGRFYRNGQIVKTHIEELEDMYLAQMAELIDEIYQEDLEMINNV